MNYKSKDGLTEAIERLRSELGVIKEELRVIEMRKPALESRAQRIAEALQMLMGDGSTGDPRWLQLPRITEIGLDRGEPVVAGMPASTPRAFKPKPGPLKRPEFSPEALAAMGEYTRQANRPVKSAELYEYLVREQLLEPIETEMPYKSFAITLRNIEQEYIDYDRNTKTWSLKDRSPKAKLKEALEKGDGTRVVSSHQLGVTREEHPFVKAVNSVFKLHRWESLSANQLFDELSEKRDFGLIPGAGSLSDFTTTMGTYTDFFDYDEETETYKPLKQETSRPDFPTGVPGLYTVKSNGNLTTV